MHATVYGGPYYGEFGHELGYAAMLRAKAEGYKHVVVCTRPARHALYTDFATKFNPHDIECESANESCTAKTQPSAKHIARWLPKEGTCDVFAPRRFHGSVPHKYVPYGQFNPRWEDVVVLHARSRPHVPMRNWSQANWNRLARRILKEGLATRLACVGTREHALMVEAAADLRGLSLAQQMDVLASAKLIIGPSSGPLHLATLCCGKRPGEHGCPQLVWCGGADFERRNTSGRYMNEWNPFGTPVDAFLSASWQPSVATVWERLERFMNVLEASA